MNMKIKPGPLFRDKFFGAPYKFDGHSKEEGFDCLSLVNSYYKELGKVFPDISDLYPLYDGDPEVREEGFKQVWERVFKATEEIPVGNIQVGDLVIFEAEGFGNYPVIYLGNGLVGGSFLDRGVMVRKYEDLDVLQIRRLL